MRKSLITLVTVLGVVSPFAASAEGGIERAEGERLSMALGHYARARSLLIAAMNEFDQGRTLADPKLILDAKTWRKSLEQRAVELERLLDPQPRVSEGGVRYEPDSRLITDAKRRREK